MVPPRGGAANLGRTMLYLTTPALWPAWPFLPLIRRGRGPEELGVLCDDRVLGIASDDSLIVYLTNLFELPPTLAAFRDLPREVFPTAAELVAAGWQID